MTSLLGYLLLLLAVPAFSWGVRLGVAKVSGRVTRWHDEFTGRSTGVSVRVGSFSYELLTAFLRGFIVAALSIALFLMLGATPALGSVGVVMFMLSLWHFWVLRSHRRMWPFAAAAGARSHELDEASAKDVLDRALDAGKSLDVVIRARWFGDLIGAALAAVLYLAALR